MLGYTPEAHGDIYALAHDLLVKHWKSLVNVEDPVMLRHEVCLLAIQYGEVGGMRYLPRQHLDPEETAYTEPPPWDTGLTGIPYEDLWAILLAVRDSYISGTVLRHER